MLVLLTYKYGTLMVRVGVWEGLDGLDRSGKVTNHMVMQVLKGYSFSYTCTRNHATMVPAWTTIKVKTFLCVIVF